MKQVDRVTPVMQAKHYVFVATTIRAITDETRYDIAVHFAQAFEKDNPKFKRARFLDACGVRHA